ncbi:agmatine deiminase [Endozoicomonas elysicola]|uniref:Putative agmatine deiminase n=1 Tax=Endozoicomonas elysicola TaxID=305900 RepID=A0A081K6Q6_9GAMM|nr:agmatine deiminase [Endozoicomonas elysicola]KEI69832.1 agmatine deiminase [Endozoicomonas elysicola]
MAKVFDTNSRVDGFRMPGEHEAQEAIWMAWPERTDSWQWGAKPAQAAFVEVAKAIAAETPVNMAVSYRQYANARALLPPHIRVVEMTTNDSWMRDMGPSYVINGEGERRGISWQFNAWGGFVDGLYFPWDADDAVAQKICEFHGDDIYQAPLVLEGGSIHVDGEGTVYTTEECLLHPSRNPDLTREEIEEYLINYLNVSKVIWLPQGLYNDVDTNGHIDNLIHVPRPGEIVLSWCDDPSDPQYDISREAMSVLLNETDAQGRQIKIHKIPVPEPMYIREEEAIGFDACEGMNRASGVRLAGSYANFLITNRRIVFPLLCKGRDEEARAALADIFPDNEIIGVEARDILLGGGNIHCITQQVPMA